MPKKSAIKKSVPAASLKIGPKLDLVIPFDWGGPIDTMSTRLNCILQVLFRDTPLDHNWRAQIRAQLRQIRLMQLLLSGMYIFFYSTWKYVTGVYFEHFQTLGTS